MYLRRAFLLIASSVLLCGFGFVQVQLDPAARQRIVSVGVAPVAVPAAQVRVRGNQSIGGLIVAGLNIAADKKLEAIMSGGYDYRKAVPDGIVRALNSAGFIATQLPGDRGKSGHDGFLKEIPTDAGVDAVLDVYVESLGFWARSATSDYQAGCHLVVRLVDPGTNQVLFQKQIIHGPVAPASGRAVVLRDPVPQTFADQDAMQANYSGTRAALKLAIDTVIAELGRQLGEPPPPPPPRKLPGSME